MFTSVEWTREMERKKLSDFLALSVVLEITYWKIFLCPRKIHKKCRHAKATTRKTNLNESLFLCCFLVLAKNVFFFFSNCFFLRWLRLRKDNEERRNETTKDWRLKTKQTEVKSGRNNLRNVIMPSEPSKNVDESLKPAKKIDATIHIINQQVSFSLVFALYLWR